MKEAPVQVVLPWMLELPGVLRRQDGHGAGTIAHPASRVAKRGGRHLPHLRDRG